LWGLFEKMTEEMPQADEAWPEFEDEEEEWPAFDEGEQPAKGATQDETAHDETWPELNDEEEAPAKGVAEEEQLFGSGDEAEEKNKRPRQRQVVKGELQKDEDGVLGVSEPVMEDGAGVADMEVKKDEEEPPSASGWTWDKVHKTVGSSQAPRVAKDQLQDMPAYEPTSPASEEFEGVRDSKGFNPLATEVPETWESDLGPRPGRTAPQGPPARKQKPAKVVGPCPVVLVGSQFNKECLLKPGRWVEVGRQPKANILLQNGAVSKHHCKLQWRKGSSSVELRVLDGVTHVNDKRLGIGNAASLKHGDLLKIYGKGACFRFLIDMKHTNDALPDVKTMSNFLAATKEAQHATRTPEEELQHKVRKMRALAEAAREKAMKYEERLTNIQTQRTLRVQKMQDELEKCASFEKDEQRLEDVLIKSRDDWLERLQDQNELQDKTGRPLNELTSETQLKRNTLEVLAKEEDRRLHPERHMASLPAPGDGPPVRPAKLEDDRAAGADLAAKADEADGEEEAFPDAPARGLGLHDDKAKDEKIAVIKPTVEVLKTAPTGADDDIADLFGDFDSEEEPLAEMGAKRQRLA